MSVIRQHSTQVLKTSSGLARAHLAGTLILGGSVLIAILVSAVCVKLGLPHTTVYGHDLFIMLDGPWRTLEGQRPHVDFYSTFGPVSYLLLAAGIKLAHYRVEGIVYATALTGLLLGVWCALLVRKWLDGFLATLVLSGLLFFWFAPFPLGEEFYVLGYAMQYNRLGYVLASLIMIELFAEDPGGGKGRASQVLGLSTGCALALLLFLKISFFLVIGPLVAATYLIRLKDKRHFAFCAGGFTVVTILFLAYLHWNASAMIRDILTAIHIRGQGVEGKRMAFRAILRNSTEILTLVALACFAAFRTFTTAVGSVRVEKIIRVVSVAFFALSADVALAVANTQKFGAPLTIVATLILISLVCAWVQPAGARPRFFPRTSPLLPLLALVVVFPTISKTVNAWTVQIAYKQKESTATPHIDADPLRAMAFDDHIDPLISAQQNDNGAALVSDINEGLALLRRHSSDSDKLACLCFANPFSFALSRPPQNGGATFFQDGLNITDKISPSASRILGDANIVIYSKSDGTRTTATLLKICNGELRHSFITVEETPHWVLLRRHI